MEKCKQLFEKYSKESGIFYSFRNNKTLDINPKYYWNGTPSAIYCYNLDITSLKQSTYRTMKDTGYVYFFKLKSCKHLNMETYTKDDYEKDLNILKELYPNIVTNDLLEKIMETVGNTKKIYATKIWELTKRISKKLIKPTRDPDDEEIHDYYKKWREMFMNELGYKYVEDPGYGIIYNGSEPAQVAIFDKDIIEIKESCEYDKTLFESKYISLANYLLS